MKKVILILMLIIVCYQVVYAQDIKLKLITGETLEGTLSEFTDSTVTIIMGDGKYVQPVVIPASKIFTGRLSNNGSIIIHDGRVILQESIREERKKEEKELYSNPHYAIGRALKVTGTTTLCIGVPFLAAGLATCIVGHTSAAMTAGL